MRLLLLTSEFLPLHGGIGTYAREMARAAAEIGLEVTLAAPDYKAELGVGSLTESDKASFPYRVIRFEGGRHTMKDIPTKMRFLSRLLAGESFDTVHAADWPFFLPFALVRRRHKGRALLTFHGTEIAEIDVRPKRLAIAATGLFNGWAEIVTNSGFTRELFLKHFPNVDPALSFAERLGVSDDWFLPGTSEAALRQKFDLAPDRKILITVSRMSRRKGHLPAIEAASRLPAPLRDKITYLAVGPTYDEAYTAEIREAAQRTGLDVRLTGALEPEDIRGLYALAGAFILPGIYLDNGDFEGFGLVYLEAAAQGLPSIAANVGGVPDAIRGGETGFLVPQNDTAALTRAIESYLGDAALRARHGEAARAWAKACSWRRCAKATYLERAQPSTSR